MTRRVFLILFALMASGCGHVQHTANAEQRIETSLLAGIGDVVLHVDKDRCLKNAFGKCDIFKRRTNEGFVDVRFLGVEPSGEIVLSRKDVAIISNETTMSRTPISLTAGRSTTSVTGSQQDRGVVTAFSGTAATTYQATTLQPETDYHVVVPSGEVAIRVAGPGSLVPVEGHIIEVLSATSYSLEYKVRQANQ